jgi:hypothetical protein
MPYRSTLQTGSAVSGGSHNLRRLGGRCHPVGCEKQDHQLRRPLILMDQTAETIPTDDLTEARKIQVTVVWRIWNAEFQAAMRSCVVVMMNVGSKHRLEMPAPGDQQPVEALLFYCSDPPLRHRIRSRCSDGRANHFHAFGRKDLIEGTAELAVTVVNQELERLGPSLEAERDVPGC